MRGGSDSGMRERLLYTARFQRFGKHAPPAVGQEREERRVKRPDHQ